MNNSATRARPRNSFYGHMLINFVGMVAALATADGARAQDVDLEARRLEVRGFGTAAATYHDADGIEFRRHTGQAHGAEAGQATFGVDSLAGVQIDYDFGAHFTAVTQGVSRQRADGDWKMHATQAFVRWSPDESLVLRVGRVGYDIYLLAESRQVGYSYLAVRPSVEFYGLLTNDEIDGGDFSYTRRAGPGLLRARLFAGMGQGEKAFADETNSHTDGRVLGACLDYLYRDWIARAALVRFRAPSPPALEALSGALRATGIPTAADVANEFTQKHIESFGLQLGVAYDGGPLQAQLLLGAVDSNTLAAPETFSGYALAGYRLRQWTPFLSFASSRNRDAVRSAGLPDLPQLAMLESAVREAQAHARATMHTISMGVRYDFAQHLDIKFQVDRVSQRDSSIIFDRRTAPGPADFTVFSVAVDFVF
jgi:hypothetical protein